MSMVLELLLIQAMPPAMLDKPSLAIHHIIMARGLLMLMLTMVDMVMEDMLMVRLMDMATDMVIIMAKDLLKLRLMLLLMAKGPLSLME